MKKGYTKFLVIYMLCLWSVPQLWAQNLSVAGKVTSQDDGSPLPGVSVLVQGTTTGTVTDLDGMFSINVPAGNTVLEFSYIGFKRQSVQLRERSTVNVALVPDISQLSEVVVTAFGIEQEKKSLVSATQEVKGRELFLSREPNMVDALNAKVAGVQVTRQGGSAGAASSIVIRGMSSITGENQPLFVIDGVPIDNSFRSASRSGSVDVPNRAIDINPNDIESINVLKGPAATALYGLQAGSGAIIITTKKGSRSETQNVAINFSSNLSVDRIMNNFPGQMTYAQGDRGLHTRGTFGHFGPPLSTLRFDGSTNALDNPRGNLVDMNNPSAIQSEVMVPVNNQDRFYQDGITMDNNISISAGNKHSSFFLSAGDYSQSGIIPENQYNRRTFRVTAETSVNDKFKITGSAYYAHSTSARFGRGDNFADVVQGTIRTPPSFDNAAGFTLANGAQRSFRNNSPDNPFWTVNNNPFTDEVNRLLGYIQANYDVTPWLNIMYRLGTDVASDKRKQQWAVGSFGGDALPGGRVQQDTYNDRILNSDLVITAKKEVGDFNLNWLVGNNYFSRNNERQYYDGRNLAIPGLYNISNVQSNLVQIQNLNQKKTAAVFSRISVDYKNYLFLELNGRQEWTSTLLPPNNSFFYGSVGSGFVFSEAFDLDEGFFSFGKLRASYSEAGRDTDPYRDRTYYGRATVSGAWGGGLVFPLPSNVGAVALSSSAGNASLRPERNKTWELGGEFRFFENRLGFDVTYYRERNIDQIIGVSVPGSTGFGTQFINAGTIENKGWEIVANASPVTGRELNWDMLFNFSRNRNTVLDLPVDRIALGGFGNLRPSLIEGEPYGVFYGTGFQRDGQGNVVIGANGYPLQAQPSDENPSGEVRLGDPTPDFLLGIRNNLSYKNFLLTFLWDIRVGGDVANVTGNWMRAQGAAQPTTDRGSLVVFRGVLADGTPNTTQVLIDDVNYYNANTGNRNIAERFIEDGSWVRLRDVTLSYSFPNALANRLKMKSLTLSAFGRNLLLFTGYSGVDPETNLYGPNNSLGVDAFGTPTTRSAGLSLTAGF